MGMARTKKFSLQLRHRLLILGAGGVVATSAVLVGVGAWQSAQFSDKARENISELTAEDLGHVTDGVSRLVTAVGDSVQASVDSNIKIEAKELADEGVEFGGGNATWKATNQ